MSADVDAVAFVVDGFSDAADVGSLLKNDWGYIGFVEQFECCCQACRAGAYYYCEFIVRHGLTPINTVYIIFLWSL